jgi:hypothetical protein
MSEYGFHLVRLVLTGAGLTDAEIRFGRGLNVISGPSDTGKTFILQCIDFMLGARDAPHEIPQADGYTTVVLEIAAVADNSRYLLSRALRGGSFLLRDPDGSERVLSETHSAGRSDTVSEFLLDLCGLSGNRVRKNARGETRSLSFRDLAHLIVIAEEDIIRSQSPVLSGQYTTRTVEKSVFRLLLSGVDDSSVVAADEPRVSRARVDAKEEVLQELASRARDQLAELAINSDAVALQDQLARLESAYADAESRLTEVGASINGIETRRRNAWTRLRQIDSRMELLRGLTERFALLRSQYESDMQRLDAISEAGLRLNDLNVERCPVCGASPEYHDVSHRSERADPNAVAGASATEASRIRSLMSDLDGTRGEIADEARRLASEKAVLDGLLSDLASTLAASLRPQAGELTVSMRTIREERDRVRQAIELYRQLAQVEAMANGLEDGGESAASTSTPDVSASDVDMLAQEAERRLRAWNFPALDRVTFSETDWDIVISGRRRASHGKGVRAVTHAAFTTALLAYCERRQLPHPGFVVMDSPLVVYREPDASEPAFSADVKGAFFRDLAATFANSQALVLENEEPPDDLTASGTVTCIRFTGTNTGRSGFIPPRRTSAQG